MNDDEKVADLNDDDKTTANRRDGIILLTPLSSQMRGLYAMVLSICLSVGSSVCRLFFCNAVCGSTSRDFSYRLQNTYLSNSAVFNDLEQPLTHLKTFIRLVV